MPLLFRIFLAFAVICAVTMFSPFAFADVASTLQTGVTWAATILRIVAIFVVIGMGLAIASGRVNVLTLLGVVVGLAIAIYPQEIVGWF